MKSRNIAWEALTLTVAILSLTNCDSLSFHPLSQTAKAAGTAGVKKLTEQSASSAPSNGKIVASSSYGIYTMNADGSDRRRLTSGTEPAWSPDGTHIAFARSESLQVGHGIYVMTADGSNQKQIAQDAHSIAWSPDGTHIAFARSKSLKVERGVYVMTANGGDQRQIAQDKDARSITWSPDGTRLAFSSWDSGDVYLLNFDGSDKSIIRHDGYSASWSPDSSELAIAGDDYAIYLVDVDGSSETRISIPPGYDSAYADPVWSPDGSKIYFTRWTRCDINGCYDPEIWTVNADGSNAMWLQRLYGFGINWSPDGTKIIFANNGDLFMMNADGSGVTNITNTNDEYENEPSWGPVLSSCADSLSTTSESFAAIGGTGSVDVTPGSECIWSASTHVDWIIIASGSSGTGNGTISYSVAANDSRAPRVGVLFAANRTLLITQSGITARITGISVAGKKLFVFGENFDDGAVIMLNGEDQKTRNDIPNPMTTLIGKNAGKKIKPGDRVQVRNPNGYLSEEFTFTSQ